MNVSVLLNGQLLDKNMQIQHLAVNSSVNYPAKAVLSVEHVVEMGSWVTRVVLGQAEGIDFMER